MSTTSVFITGASSGIGRDCALTLDRAGSRVFAGVRNERDAQALRDLASPKLTPVLCDVTDYASVASAAQRVRELLAGEGLDGLINNAGVSVSGPLELLPMSQLEMQMSVNVTGQVAVTQAFLPLLRQSRGRIVFMGSESGLATLPLLGAYSASKHALEAVANAFRLELHRFGIHVALIEPGSIKTAIWGKAVDSGIRSLKDDPELRALYAAELPLLTEMPKLAETMAVAPSAVTRAVRHALSARWPKARYLVGLEARALTLFIALTPTWLSDFFIRLSIRLLAARFAPRVSPQSQSQS
jgi:NAD(P)-dependent dehydrogenase (short-subunit alcohol dehydrogenase family)